MKPTCLWKAIVPLLVLAAGTAYADIASEVRGGKITNNGGYFELGLATGYIHSPLRWKFAEEDDGPVLDIDGSGEYRYNNFFLEAVQGTQDGLNLGYTFWQNADWTLDFLAGSVNGYYVPDFLKEDPPEDEEERRNHEIYHRNSLYLGTGLRVTRYIDKYVVQYRLLTDTFDDNGLSTTLRVGRGWQIRNWNIHGIISAVYNSAETNHYWFGIDEDEATTKYPAYAPDDSLSLDLQIGLVRPLSEKWVLRIFAGWTQAPKEARNSPLVDDSNGSYGLITVNRVFNLGG